MNLSVRTLSATVALSAAAAAALTLAPAALAPATAAARGDQAESSRGQSQLAAVRAATAKYHRVDVALADGYLPTEECVATPEGAMGIHYVNPERFASIDAERPSILLYVPTEDGLRLAGVEWLQVDADQDLATDEDRPSLFGRPFDGPMPGHEAEMPVHYDLHAWVWAHNPSGTFAPFNPALGC